MIYLIFDLNHIKLFEIVPRVIFKGSEWRVEVSLKIRESFTSISARTLPKTMKKQDTGCYRAEKLGRWMFQPLLLFILIDSDLRKKNPSTAAFPAP